MRPKSKKRKPKVFLTDEQKREFAQKLLNGMMVKQVAAEYGVSDDHGRKIAQEYLVWKMNWKHRAKEDA